MPRTILILPGMNGSGPAHWQTAWEKLLPDARRVHARDWDHPECDEWISALDAAIAGCGSEVVLVAHSLGCLQVACWAAASPPTLPRVKGALLVAPPDPALPAFPVDARGFHVPAAGRLPFPSIVVASRNDPYGSWTFAEGCARRWGSEIVDVGSVGHINADSGLGDWLDGRDLLDRLARP